jgi:hypothetical protein
LATVRVSGALLSSLLDPAKNMTRLEGGKWSDIFCRATLQGKQRVAKQGETSRDCQGVQEEKPLVSDLQRQSRSHLQRVVLTLTSSWHARGSWGSIPIASTLLTRAFTASKGSAEGPKSSGGRDSGAKHSHELSQPAPPRCDRQRRSVPVGCGARRSDPATSRTCRTVIPRRGGLNIDVHQLRDSVRG